MMGFNRRLAMATTAALLGTLIGCDSDVTRPDKPSRVNSGPELVMGRALRPTLDDEFREIARAIPGFAGFYLEPVASPVANPGAQAGTEQVMIARLVDLSQEGAATERGRVFSASRRLRIRGYEARKAEYNFLQLSSWYEKLLSIQNLPGVVFTDIDEVANRLRVGVLDVAAIGAIRSKAASAGVPASVLIVERAEPMHAKETLRDYVSPAAGGIQIQMGLGICTLSFVVDRGTDGWPDATDRGFVTNSHCTEFSGAVDNGAAYQPSAASGNILGYEIADPPFAATAGCPAGRLCRYSDAALFEYVPEEPFEMSRIAKAVNNWTTPNTAPAVLSPPQNRVTIAYEYAQPVSNQQMAKTGRTTGTTGGPVTQTCVTVNVVSSSGAPTNKTLLCQYTVDARNLAGDSGSPVHGYTEYILPGDPYQPVGIYGILWGGNDAGTRYSMSPLGSVENELGPFRTECWFGTWFPGGC